MGVPINPVPANPFLATAPAGGIAPAGGPFVGGVPAGIYGMNVMTVDQAAGGLAQIIPLEQPDMRPEIFVVNGNVSPITVFLNRLRRVVGGNQRHIWKVIEPMGEVDTVAGSVAVGAAGFTVGNPALLTANCVLRFISPDGEFWVNTVNQTTGAITGTWVVPLTAGVAAGATFIKLSNAHRHFDFPVPQPYPIEVQYSNYYQHHYHTELISRMTEAGRFPMLGPGGIKAQKRKMLEDEHFKEVEKTYIWGMQALDITGSNPAGFTHGLYSWATTIRHSNAGAPLTLRNFEDHITRFTINRIPDAAGPNGETNDEIIHFCGNRQIEQITRAARAAAVTNITSGKHPFGFFCTTITTANGTKVAIMKHPLFDQLGFYGMGLTVRMSGNRLAAAYHPACLGTKVGRPQTGTIPYLGTYGQFGYETISTLEVCDEEGTVAVLEDVG